MKQHPHPEDPDVAFAPGHMPEAAYAAVAERLGPHLMHRRLRRERRREERPVTLIRPHVHPQNLNCLAPLFEALLRATKLRERARETFFNMEVHEHAITLNHLSDRMPPLRMLHITDLHLDMVPELAARTAARLDGLPADICLLTGDLRASLTEPLDNVMALLRECLAPLRCPIYACLGNHDLLNMVLPLEAAGIRVLLNEWEQVEINGTSLLLAGIDDPAMYKTHDLDKALPDDRKGMPLILLSHSPCTWRQAVAIGVDLVLSGHTHGGQICLPNGVPIFTNDAAPRHLCSGPWAVGATQGYTSRGIGGSTLVARLNCRPEIVTHVISGTEPRV